MYMCVCEIVIWFFEIIKFILNFYICILYLREEKL